MRGWGGEVGWGGMGAHLLVWADPPACAWLAALNCLTSLICDLIDSPGTLSVTRRGAGVLAADASPAAPSAPAGGAFFSFFFSRFRFASRGSRIARPPAPSRPLLWWSHATACDHETPCESTCVPPKPLVIE